MTTGSKSNLVLVVEDSPADVFLIREAIEAVQRSAFVQIVRDGEQAIRFFEEADNDEFAVCPALVILDINLPRKQGGDVLKHMRYSKRCADIPVIVVSSSQSGRDRDEMTKLGADRYFSKPSDFAEFMKLGDLVKEMLGN